MCSLLQKQLLYPPINQTSCANELALVTMDRNREMWSSIYQRFNVCCFHACTVCLERLFLHRMFCIFGHNYTNYNLWSIVMLKQLNTTDHVAYRCVHTAKALIAKICMTVCWTKRTGELVSWHALIRLSRVLHFLSYIVRQLIDTDKRTPIPTLNHNFVMRWALVLFDSLRWTNMCVITVRHGRLSGHETGHSLSLYYEYVFIVRYSCFNILWCIIKYI
jgi:hypothetical protein